jgi:hypothetical protein
MARSMRRGLSILEMEVALVLLSMTLVTVASLTVTQWRMAASLEGPFTDGATLYLTRCDHKWVRALGISAVVAAEPDPCPLGTTLLEINTVTVLDRQIDLISGAMGATVQVEHPLPDLPDLPPPPGLPGQPGLPGLPGL